MRDASDTAFSHLGPLESGRGGGGGVSCWLHLGTEGRRVPGLPLTRQLTLRVSSPPSGAAPAAQRCLCGRQGSQGQGPGSVPHTT